MRVMKGGGGPVLNINARFFFNVLEIQCWLALVLASWVAPRLISYDMGDNALPILLSHPISRFGYLLGKFIALAISLSCVTWIPVLILFMYQCYASQGPWTVEHLPLALDQCVVQRVLEEGVLEQVGASGRTAFGVQDVRLCQPGQLCLQCRLVHTGHGGQQLEAELAAEHGGKLG